MSHEFQLFCEDNGIKHVTSAPYHQSSNGQAERFVQTVKKGLKMNNIEEGNSQFKLHNYLFAYRMTPSTVTGCTPAKLFLGRDLKSKLDLVKPKLKSHEIAIDKYSKRRFNIGNNVFVRDYVTKNKWVPGIIVRKIGSSLYDVKVGSSVCRRHVDQIIEDFTELAKNTGDEYMDVDFDNQSEAGVRPTFRSSRIPIKSYPIRNRKPVNRYGVS